MHVVSEANLLRAYLKCATLVVEKGVRKSDMAEVQDLLCKVVLSPDDVHMFKCLVRDLESHPELVKGHQKALRAYQRHFGSITKPSYIGRLRGYPFLKPGTNDLSPVDQFEIVVNQFREAPQSSNLGMVLFHPNDIRDAFRPGYVPCLSFIDIKFRGGSLSTKFYFRSCDFAEVALFDFYHCLNIHGEIASMFAKARPGVTIAQESILWNFSRAFTYNRRRKPIEIIRMAASDILSDDVDGYAQI
ncbi:hypothetical protein GO308_03370 [Sphingomonas sp. SFZ2018-12]|uniref:thymidylate synthase n=1 Tax=Sphingomonas sp. SFZ2018-12 TaxID=2683197 RepID=UPI001F0F773C|nr:thymidylate synthase [Sphingomonas sp. SFZ2018-12]MCH4892150.1 hypothetical protein [Sphingomonas sp. SFZ2018-12]